MWPLRSRSLRSSSRRHFKAKSFRATTCPYLALIPSTHPDVVCGEASERVRGFHSCTYLGPHVCAGASSVRHLDEWSCGNKLSEDVHARHVVEPIHLQPSQFTDSFRFEITHVNVLFILGRVTRRRNRRGSHASTCRSSEASGKSPCRTWQNRESNLRKGEIAVCVAGRRGGKDV